jgi:hypothetical protein
MKNLLVAGLIALLVFGPAYAFAGGCCEKKGCACTNCTPKACGSDGCECGCGK